MVSIHAPVTGAWIETFAATGPATLTLSPPHGGVDSIHAPVRGRRGLMSPPHGRAWISIHAPVRGRRLARKARLACMSFNRRPLTGAWIETMDGNYARDCSFNRDAPPHGGVPRLKRAGRLVSRVSIHAPVRGRRRGRPARQGGKIVSIHAPVTGRRSGIETATGAVSIHAPVRGRLSIISSMSGFVRRFNPRPRHGGDWI